MSSDEARVDNFQSSSWLSQHGPLFCVSAGVGILLAISGAFGTMETPLAVRLLYWVSVMLVGSLIGWAVSSNIIKLERWTKSPFLTWLIITLVVGFLMAPIVLLLGVGFGWTTFSAGPDIIGYLINSLAISGFMAGVGVFLDQVPQVTLGSPVAPVNTGVDDASVATKSIGQPAILSRMPAHIFGASIFAVEAQDHYLKIYTSRGNEMILMRLKDALSELNGIKGARVHRSWWVARGAVVSADKGNGKAILNLANGLDVPVSRSFARALREDGWF